MCTAMSMQISQGNAFLSRTLDFSYPLEPELYFVPKDYEWNNLRATHNIHNRYAYMGIGQDISPIVFADGVNEMGFAAAALYFPGYAGYDPIDCEDPAAISIAAIELTGFLLGLSASVEEAAELLPTVRIVGLKDSVTDSVAPLHWSISDKSGKSMVIEKCADGLRLMDNPVGVLSNSPDFQWHLTNLRNYMNISPVQYSEKNWGCMSLTPFGQGAGAIGLPGDFTPPSRFVRTAFQKSHLIEPDGRDGAVTACFHILEGVSIPKGNVMTDRGTADYTQYTAVIDLTEREYFFRTYENSGITAVKLPGPKTSGSDIVSLGGLNRPLSFNRLNFAI